MRHRSADEKSAVDALASGDALRLVPESGRSVDPEALLVTIVEGG